MRPGLQDWPEEFQVEGEGSREPLVVLESGGEGSMQSERLLRKTHQTWACRQVTVGGPERRKQAQNLLILSGCEEFIQAHGNEEEVRELSLA